MNARNKYTRKFKSICPVNGQNVKYKLVIWSNDIILVEAIIGKTENLEPSYHEDIADDLVSLGGLQILTAFHHGVEIETVRGGI